MSIIVLNIGVFLFIFHYTQPYRDLGKNTSYKNRESTPSVLGNVSYSNMDITEYSLEDIDKTSQLPLYSMEEHTSVDGLEYLGKDEDLYFFKDNKRDIVYNLETTSELVHFSSDLESNVDITTKTAKLNDPSFIKNGFKKEVGPTTTRILVNKELKPIYYRHHVPTKKLKKV